MRLTPGGFAWLLAHDLRQSWRGGFAVFGAMGRAKIAAIMIGVVVGLHAVAGVVVLALNGRAGGEASIAGWFAVGALASLSWMVAQGMNGAMRSLYARGDYDLLFASPVSPHVVLASRSLTIAAEGAASSLLLIAPLADMGALLGHRSWLAMYPTLISSAFFGAGLGLMIALGMFLAFGPRRARLFSQVAATLIGAGFVLGAQVVNMLPERWREPALAALWSPQPGSWMARDGLLDLPARAARGDVHALGLWALVGYAAFALAVVVCAPIFVHAVASASGAPGGGGARRGPRAFRAGFRANLRAKERRLVLRDPWLLSQILMQILYTLPLSVVLWRNGGITGSAAIAFAPALVAIAAQLAGALAWVALSGEDAPDFLATAPIARRDVERGKLEAIAGLILAVMGLPLLGLALVSPRGALVALAFGVGAAASSALVNLWRQAPAPKRMMLHRHAQSKLVGLIEHVVTLLWAIASALAIFGSWTALIPLGLAALALWLNRPRRARQVLASA